MAAIKTTKFTKTILRELRELRGKIKITLSKNIVEFHIYFHHNEKI